MRWSVEVSPLGKSEAQPEHHCVEAAQWQKALSQVRKHAGHDETLRNFSIEVLDDGVRAVDPMVRLRYLLKRAPNDTPVTLGEQAPVARSVDTTPGTPSAPPVSAAPAASQRRSFAQTMVFGSSGAASLQRPSSPGTPASAPIASTPAATAPIASTPAAAAPIASTPAAAAPIASTPPAAAPIASTPHATAPIASTPHATAPIASTPPAAAPVNAPAPQAAPTSPVPIAVVSASAPPSALPYKLLMQRAQEPTAASPITYREMAFGIREGASELEGERFIRERFEEVRGQLASAATGKLVNLAVFDHVFEKKPLRPPLVTLVWKDWKHPEPELRFPMRPGTSMPPPSLGMPSQPGASQPPRAASSPSVPAIATASQPPRAASSPSVPAIAQPAPSFPVPSAAHADVPTPASTPIAIRKESPVQPPVAVEAPTGPTTARLGSIPPASLQAQAPVSKAAPVPTQPQPRVRKPTPGGMVDIVTELFEVMHDLHFLRDVQEGAGFVLTLALEKLQSQYALVQLYDINRREFVVIRAAGPNAASTINGRTSERDPLLTEVMQRRTPFVIEASHDPRVRVGRWRALGAEPTLVLAAAVAQGGRFLGVLEVGCEPGRTYAKQHIDGMAYIAQAFSEFLATRGIVFSDDPGR